MTELRTRRDEVRLWAEALKRDDASLVVYERHTEWVGEEHPSSLENRVKLFSQSDREGGLE